MFSLFKRIPVYIKLFHNKIEITNLKTGETLTRTATTPFSSDRLIVASFAEADSLIRSMMKEIGLRRSFPPLSFKILMQQMENVEGGLSDVEKRALRDLVEQAGANVVLIATNTKALSHTEALDVLEKN